MIRETLIVKEAKMHDPNYYETHDFRIYKNDKNDERSTWKETLEYWCKCYGTYGGRWHDKKFWKMTLEALPKMTEEDAEKICRKIERDADGDLDYWRMMQ